MHLVAKLKEALKGLNPKKRRQILNIAKRISSESALHGALSKGPCDSHTLSEMDRAISAYWNQNRPT